MFRNDAMARLPAVMAAVVGAAMTLLAAPAFAKTEECEDRWNDWVHERRALESELISAFPDALVRTDRTLTVVADNGNVQVFEDFHHDCSEHHYYQVIKYFPSLTSFLIEVSGGLWTSFRLVHKPTGTMVKIHGFPLLDQTGLQFAVAVDSADDEFGAPQIAIGHVANDGIVLDVDLTIYGYVLARWIDRDHIALESQWPWTKIPLSDWEREDIGDEFDDATYQSELVRKGGVWQLVETVTIPLGMD